MRTSRKYCLPLVLAGTLFLGWKAWSSAQPAGTQPDSLVGRNLTLRERVEYLETKVQDQDVIIDKLDKDRSKHSYKHRAGKFDSRLETGKWVHPVQTKVELAKGDVVLLSAVGITVSQFYYKIRPLTNVRNVTQLMEPQQWTHPLNSPQVISTQALYKAEADGTYEFGFGIIKDKDLGEDYEASINEASIVARVVGARK